MNRSVNLGGAVLVSTSARFVARDSGFFGNAASNSGGGIAAFGLANISDSQFERNSAFRGGAIQVGNENGLLSVNSSTFFENRAVANGSAISSTTSSITLINDSQFSLNVVEDGIGDTLFIGDVGFHRVENSTID